MPSAWLDLSLKFIEEFGILKSISFLPGFDDRFITIAGKDGHRILFVPCRLITVRDRQENTTE